jgi:hypothetical protein
MFQPWIVINPPNACVRVEGRSLEHLPRFVRNHWFDRIVELLDMSPQNLTDLLDRRTLREFFLDNDYADVLTIEVGHVDNDHRRVLNDDVIDLVYLMSLPSNYKRGKRALRHSLPPRPGTHYDELWHFGQVSQSEADGDVELAVRALVKLPLRPTSTSFPNQRFQMVLDIPRALKPLQDE